MNCLASWKINRSMRFKGVFAYTQMLPQYMKAFGDAKLIDT